MVATTTKIRRPTRRPQRRDAWRDAIPGVHIASAEEGRMLFDAQAQKHLGISGDDFLVRWDGGEYRHVADPDEAREVERLTMLIPFVRRVRS